MNLVFGKFAMSVVATGVPTGESSAYTFLPHASQPADLIGPTDPKAPSEMGMLAGAEIGERC